MKPMTPSNQVASMLSGTDRIDHEADNNLRTDPSSNVGNVIERAQALSRLLKPKEISFEGGQSRETSEDGAPPSATLTAVSGISSKSRHLKRASMKRHAKRSLDCQRSTNLLETQFQSDI